MQWKPVTLQGGSRHNPCVEGWSGDGGRGDKVLDNKFERQRERGRGSVIFYTDKKEKKISSYTGNTERIGCKVIYEEGLR